MNKSFEEMSEVDVAYHILTEAGKDNSIYYKDLILDILKKKNKPIQNEAAAISEVYTMINMDSRFQYASEGKWGLSEWNPPEIKKRGKTTTSKIEKSEEE
jgi:DNA-directed RNA polymerase subunit delta